MADVRLGSLNNFTEPIYQGLVYTWSAGCFDLPVEKGNNLEGVRLTLEDSVIPSVDFGGYSLQILRQSRDLLDVGYHLLSTNGSRNNCSSYCATDRGENAEEPRKTHIDDYLNMV